MYVFLAAEEDKGRNDALDAKTSYITIRLKSGEEYRIGGYAASLDDEFNQLETQIIEAVGEEKYNLYIDKINSADLDSI